MSGMAGNKGFGLVGLAAPQGLLGPEGTKRGAAKAAPLYLALSAAPMADPWEKALTDPKTQSCPCAERREHLKANDRAAARVHTYCIGTKRGVLVAPPSRNTLDC